MQSLREFLSLFGKWWWVVVVDYIFGLAGVYQTVTGTTTFSHVVWAIVFILAFTIPPLIAFGIIRKSRDEWVAKYTAVLDTKPSIEAIPEVDSGGDYYLRVRNLGERAEFRSKVEVASGSGFIRSLPTRYSAYWEGTKSETTEIDKWDDDRLHIAKLEAAPLAQADAVEDVCMNWRFYYYDVGGVDAIGPFGSIQSLKSTSWFTVRKDIQIPDIALKVSITSHPSTKTGFSKTYQLTVGGLVETSS